MAEVHITEYQGIGQDPMGNQVQVAHGERARQVVSFSATSQQSAPFWGHYVRLFSDRPCRIAFGLNPVADATSTPLAAEAPEFFSVTPGQRVAVIERS